MSGEIKILRCDDKDYAPYVNDDGIYVPIAYAAYGNLVYHQRIITKEMFVEAYNKWIKKELTSTFVDRDDADCWCE